MRLYGLVGVKEGKQKRPNCRRVLALLGRSDLREQSEASGQVFKTSRSSVSS